MITELTDEQRAKLPEYKQRWITFGLATGDCDFEKAKLAAKKAYTLANYEPPEYFFLVDSPFAAAEAMWLLQRGFDIETCDWEKELKNATRSELQEFFDSHYPGNHEAHRLGFYEFFKKECGIEACSKLDGLTEIAHSCGWWWARKNFCVFSHKPDAIHFNDDEDKKLHNSKGPAISFRDGRGIYCLYGVTVEKEMLDYNPEQIMSVKNAEQRMVLIKNYGLDKMLDKLKSKVIDEYTVAINEPDNALHNLLQSMNITPRKQKLTYELLLVRLENRDCEYLKMINPSTGETHVEGVKPGIKTVKQALAWRAGLDEYTDPVFAA